MPTEGHVFKHVSYLGKVTHSLENTVSSKSQLVGYMAQAQFTGRLWDPRVGSCWEWHTK